LAGNKIISESAYGDKKISYSLNTFFYQSNSRRKIYQNDKNRAAKIVASVAAAI
jgi:hypothetical protein